MNSRSKASIRAVKRSCQLVAIIFLGITGCSEKPDPVLVEQVRSGEYGQARARLLEQMESEHQYQNPNERSYTLARMQLAMAELADGLPKSADVSGREVWNILCTRGLNADKKVEERVFYEGVRRWKGEPFEQAMMCCYRAIQQAMLGKWDEAGVAAGESLFLLKDFGEEMATEGAKRHECSQRWLTGQLLGMQPEQPQQEPFVQLDNEGRLASIVPTVHFFNQLRKSFQVNYFDDVVNDQDVLVIRAVGSAPVDQSKLPPPEQRSVYAAQLAFLAQSGLPMRNNIEIEYAFSKETGVAVQLYERITTLMGDVLGRSKQRTIIVREMTRDYGTPEINAPISRSRFEISTSHPGEERSTEVSSTTQPAREEQELLSLSANVKSLRVAYWTEGTIKTITENRTAQGWVKVAQSEIPNALEGTIEQLRENQAILTRMESVRPAPKILLTKTSKKNDNKAFEQFKEAKSDFVLGYLLRGVAGYIVGQTDVAREDIQEVLSLSPRLKKLTERIVADQYNTLLVVDYGAGPEKIAYGPDNALVAFEPVARHLPGRLNIRIGDSGPSDSAVMVCDLNHMATDHRWNNLEDVRIAKSRVGDFFVKAGQNSNNVYVQLLYLSVGAALKAGAHADTRQCKMMPARVYMAPITLVENRSNLDITAPDGSAKMKLVNLGPPVGKEKQMLYVRMCPRGCPDWQVSDRVLYANDYYEGPVEGDDLPYILGGRCVRKPIETVLKHYQDAGYLKDFSLSDLEELYKLEGIALEQNQENVVYEGEGKNKKPIGGRAGLHVLECRRMKDDPKAPEVNGTSLECPVPGSAGYKRLFCQQHEPYVPRSERVRELTNQIKAQRTSAPKGAASN